MAWAPTPGLWDYDGSYAKQPGQRVHSWETFTVGVFQWVAKSSGRGVKRGKAVKRISGLCSDPKSVFARAEALCLELEAKGNALVEKMTPPGAIPTSRNLARREE
jgi:hypothetical protein